MTIVIAVVRVVVVVVPVNGHRAMRRSRAVRIPNVVGVRAVPAPAVVETAVIPEGIVVVGTIVIVRPPPVVAQVDADAPAGGRVVVPVQVGEVRVVVAPTGVNVGVETTDAGTICVIVVIVRVIRVGARRTSDGGRSDCRVIHLFHVSGDHGLAAAGIIG